MVSFQHLDMIITYTQVELIFIRTVDECNMEMCRSEGQVNWLKTIQHLADVARRELEKVRETYMRTDGSLALGAPTIPVWEKHEDGATQFGKLPPPLLHRWLLMVLYTASTTLTLIL